jgi:hypothetical protein
MHLAPSHGHNADPFHSLQGASSRNKPSRFVRLRPGETPHEAVARHREATGFRGLAVILL